MFCMLLDFSMYAMDVEDLSKRHGFLGKQRRELEATTDCLDTFMRRQQHVLDLSPIMLITCLTFTEKMSVD